MQQEGIARLFEGSSETGAIAPRALTARQMRIALTQVSEAKSMEWLVKSQTMPFRYIDWVPDYRSPVERYIPFGRPAKCNLPATIDIVGHHLTRGSTAEKAMRLGFQWVAKAAAIPLSERKEDPKNVRLLLRSAAGAIQTSVLEIATDFRNSQRGGAAEKKIARVSANQMPYVPTIDSALEIAEGLYRKALAL